MWRCGDVVMWRCGDLPLPAAGRFGVIKWLLALLALLFVPI